MNWVAAVLSLPAASVKAPDATSMVTAPAADGVKVAVYIVDETVVKLLSAPLVTVMSPTMKFEVASLEVKVKDNVESSDVPPSDTSAAAMVIVGGIDSALVVKENAVVLLIPA